MAVGAALLALATPVWTQEAPVAEVLTTARPANLATAPAELARRVQGALPGDVVVAIWRNGQLATAGVRDGKPLPDAAVTGPAARLFEIGSISKVFTGLLLAQEVEAGRLTLDDTLGALLQDCVSFASPHAAAITLRQLMTHTACLPRLSPDFFQGSDRANPYRGYDRERLWRALGATVPRQAPPCAALYSNYGFAVLGEVLAQRAGKPWAQLVREHITEPLALHDTVQTLDARAPRLAQPFAENRPTPPWDFDAYAGAGALRATAEDLVRFGRALLAGRKGPLGAAAERMVQPQARFDGDIGYALFITGPQARRTYLHNGGTGGFRSQLLLAADTDEVAVILAANSQGPVYAVGSELTTSRYPVVPQTPPTDPGPLADYMGVYRENRQSALTVVAQDGRLYAKSTGQPFRPLDAEAPGSFTRAPLLRARFVRGAAGTVERLLWEIRGSVITTIRTAEPVPAVATLPDAVLQAYVGRYRAPKFDFDVRAANGQLTIQLTGQPRYPVFVVAGATDRFAWDVVTAEAQFKRYANGEVHTLELHQNGITRAQRLD